MNTKNLKWSCDEICDHCRFLIGLSLKDVFCEQNHESLNIYFDCPKCKRKNLVSHTNYINCKDFTQNVQIRSKE